MLIRAILNNVGEKSLKGLFTYNQSTHYSGSSGLRLSASATELEVIPNRVYPNPLFKGFETTIEFELKTPSNVTLQIVNGNGEVLKTLASGVHSEGLFRCPFSLNNVGNGIALLYYRLTVEDYVTSKRIIFLK